MKTMLSTKDLADRWGMAVGTLENWRLKNKGPKWVKLGGAKNSDVRYRVKDVDSWESKNVSDLQD